MKYTHFETLSLVLGSLAIVGSVFIAPSASSHATEVAAQLLIIVVFGSALHWGRNGGFLAALLALMLYVAMLFPLLRLQGLSSEVLTMLVSRSITYALVGIVGGEVASRIKYVFARLENDSLIDPVTGVYSPRYASESILSGLGQWERYHSEFSVIELSAPAEPYSRLKPSQHRQLMKQVASHLRSDIRMVDDLAFRSPATFIVLLPGTPEAGARVVAERLAPAFSSILGLNAEGFDVAVLSASTDSAGLHQLATSLVPEEPEHVHEPSTIKERRRATDEA